MLTTAGGHARHFDTLLKSGDPTVKAACFEVALPET
jgi:hypothetical protein